MPPEQQKGSQDVPPTVWRGPRPPTHGGIGENPRWALVCALFGHFLSLTLSMGLGLGKGISGPLFPIFEIQAAPLYENHKT